MVKVPKVGFLSSGDATFRRLGKTLRYVNIVGKARKYRRQSPARKVDAAPPEKSTPPRPFSRSPPERFAVPSRCLALAAPPFQPKPAGTLCGAEQVSMLAALGSLPASIRQPQPAKSTKLQTA
ncbi:MAG: hypothetical protein IJQ82_12095, partial [Selenomonadaceae bacterium]|nr:hypothetical protein [Selenomonadaceae bacterium]